MPLPRWDEDDALGTGDLQGPRSTGGLAVSAVPLLWMRFDHQLGGQQTRRRPAGVSKALDSRDRLHARTFRMAIEHS